MAARPGRIGRAALALVLLTTALAFVVDPLAAPASAAGSGQALTNKVLYGANQTVYASGAISFVQKCKEVSGRPPVGVDDIFQPWADLYIIESGTPAVGGKLTDVNGAPNVIFGGLGGGFVEEVIARTGPSGNLPAGVYDIVIDECQDGYFDSDDAHMSQAFRVVIPLGTQPATIDSSSKARSDQLSSDWKTMAFGWQKLLEAVKERKHVGVTGLSTITDMSIGIVTAYMGSSLPDPRPAAHAAMLQLSRKHAGLAADPPDPAFNGHVGLDAGEPVPVSTGRDPLEGLLLDSSASAGVDAALFGALVTAVERHQGAAEVGNGDWMNAQAADAIEIIDVLTARRSETADQLRAVGTAFWSDISRWRNWLDRGYYAGAYVGAVNQTTRRDSMNRGVTSDQVMQHMVDFHALLPGDQIFGSGDDIRPRVGRLADDMEASIDELAALRADLVVARDGVIAEDRGGPRPTADAGGPYAATTATGVTLDASASTGPDPIAIYEWDLDLDGDFDDATGATPTYAPDRSGNRVVALKVTDSEGRTDLAFAVVDVAVGDLPPTITAMTPTPTVLEVSPGDTVDFSVTASDPEGQPVTITWDRDGTTVGTGSTLSFAAPDEYGSYRYDALVTDPAGNLTAQAFLLTVYGPDADGDGWRVPADCDDANANVHPARAEVRGNGIDDDCNPDTTDIPEAPRADAPALRATIDYLSQGLQEGDEIFVRVTWTHPDRYSGQPFRYSLDWGDGTITEGTVAGTTFAQTDIVLPHTYRSAENFRVTACLTSPEGLESCATRAQLLTDTTKFLPAPPVVHPANLEDWTSYLTGRPGEVGVSGTPRWWVSPGGYSGIETTNNNFAHLAVSDFDLVATDEKPARIAFDFGTSGDDDDYIGFALGVDVGEVERDDSDWMLVSLAGHDETEAAYWCEPPAVTNLVREEPMIVSRYRGYFHWLEMLMGDKVVIPGAGDPLCTDDAGPEQLAALHLPDPLGHPIHGYWKRLTHPDLLHPGSADSTRGTLYHAEVTYSPSLLVIEIDGVELVRLTAEPDDPFPMGPIALFSASQPLARLIGHTQVPRVAVEQGELHEFSAPFADADLQGGHTAVIEWGDGSPATQATITQTAEGHWLASAETTYQRAGTFEAEVCVTDPTDDLVGCGAIIVDVANVAPIVEAGPEATVGADFSLTGAHYSDPGTLDTHTATVDWGDGSPVEPATLDGRPGSGLISASHHFTTPGTFEVEVCVTDDPGPDVDPLTGCDTLEVTVAAPVAPSALITDGPTAPEGTPIDIGVGFTDETRDLGHTATIDWGDGSTPETVDLQDGGEFGSGWATRAYRDDGSYDVTVTICDAGDLCDTASTTVTVTNTAPTIDADSAVSGGTLTITGSAADDGADDVLTATVDWGDGSAPESVPLGADGSFTAAHGYGATGTFAVEICVTDDSGAEACDGTEVEITEVAGPPIVVELAGPNAVEEGTEVTVTGAVDDPTGASTSVEVDWGDGSSPETVALDADDTFEARHSYGDDGVLTVTAMACSAPDRCDADTLDIEVSNVAPAVEAGRDRITTGQVVLDDSTFTDPGTGDTHTATVDWGDGGPLEAATVARNATGGAIHADHTYAAPGSHTVEICVTDDDGGADCDTFTVIVEAGDAPFVVTATTGPPTDEGSEASVDATITDPEPGPNLTATGVLQATVRWADGSAPETFETAVGDTLELRHVYADDGSYPVSIEVCDTSARCATGTATVTVTNVAPTVVGASAAESGLSVIVTADVTDPGVFDTHTSTIDWGDGTDPETAPVVGGEILAQHRYAAAGSYTIEVCASDDDGGIGCAELEIDVEHVNTPPSLDVEEVDSTDEGSELVLSGSFADSDTDDTWTLRIGWGDGTDEVVEDAAPGPFELRHVYADDGNHTIVVTVDDGTDTKEVLIYGVTVRNVAPAVSADVDVDDLTATVTATLLDPGALDVLAATIDWGDGTIEDLVPGVAALRAAGPDVFTGTHTYRTEGRYEAEVCGRDDDGGRTCIPVPITVRAATQPPTTEAPPTTSTTEPVGATTTAPSGGGGGGAAPGTGAAPSGRGAGGTLSRTGYPIAAATIVAVTSLFIGAAVLTIRRRRAA